MSKSFIIIIILLTNQIHHYRVYIYFHNKAKNCGSIIKVGVRERAYKKISKK